MLSPLSLGSVKFGAVNPASSRADAGESCAVGVAGELMSDMIAPYRSSDFVPIQSGTGVIIPALRARGLLDSLRDDLFFSFQSKRGIEYFDVSGTVLFVHGLLLG